MSIDMVVTDDGCQLWSEVRGHGNTVVLNHGGPGLANNLGTLQERLMPSYHVVRWDQRGCGRSEPRGPYSIARSVADLSAVVDRQGGRAVLVGHSWGATLSLHYALARPESVRALVYVSGTGTGQSWKSGWRRTVASRMSPEQVARVTELEAHERSAAEDRELALLQWAVDFADPGSAQRLLPVLIEPWFDINHDCNAAINAETSGIRETDLLDRCRSLPLPVLVVQGREDPRPVGALDALCAVLPEVRREVFSGVGHFPWLEAPEAFDAVVREFLDDVGT